MLLEKDGAAATPFNWADATVYFVITDRFFNGDPSNDHPYGRAGDGAQEIGTWHGGDLAGLTQNLDYFRDMGMTAIWISPAVEQVHGWVAGGNGDFKYYGYTGYWALDERIAIARSDEDLLDLDAMLKKLAELDPAQAQLVELRIFGGMTVDEAAAEMGLSKRTAEREWTAARAWLFREIGNGRS